MDPASHHRRRQPVRTEANQPARIVPQRLTHDGDAGRRCRGGHRQATITLPFEVRGERRNGVVRGVVEPSGLTQGGAGTQPAGEVPGCLAGRRRNAVIAGEVLQLGPRQFRCRILVPRRQSDRVIPGLDVQAAAPEDGPAEPWRAEESGQEQQPCRRGGDGREWIDAGGSGRGCSGIRDWNRCGSNGSGRGQGFFFVGVGAEVARDGVFRCVIRHHATRRGGFERDPAKALKVEFGPGVGVPGVHLIFGERALAHQGDRFAGEAARCVTDCDAAWDAFGPCHHRHG
ncbi:hypothetical protein PJL15_03555 [Paenarthrobacter nitroguajacolicus]|nr:hypothetical protein [Paenarthrobacter nitroguajacolicus]